MLPNALNNLNIQHHQSTTALDQEYRKRSRELLENEHEAVNQHQQTSLDLMITENTIKANTNLVKLLIADVRNNSTTNFPILTTSNEATLKLFYKCYPGHLAIAYGHIDVLRTLLELSRKDPARFFLDYRFPIEDHPPLWEMAFTDDNPAFTQLMLNHIMLDLEKIAMSNNLSWLVNAIRLKPEIINAQLEIRTLAMRLAEHNQLAVLKEITGILREKAAKHGHTSTLPEAYDFLHKLDIERKSIVHYALKEGHKELALFLLQESQLPLSPLEQACINGKLDDVQNLLRANIHPARHDQAALMWAIIHNQLDIVKALITSNKINVKVHDNIAVITAIRYGYFAIAKLLITAGADILAQDNLAEKLVTKLTPENSGLTLEQIQQKQAQVKDFISQYQHTSPTFKLKEEARKAQENINNQQRIYFCQREEQARRLLTSSEQREFDPIKPLEKSQRPPPRPRLSSPERRKNALKKRFRD